MSNWGSDGWVVRSGAGQRVALGGPHVPEVLLRGRDVADALGVFTFDHAVITENPPHAHNGFAKIAYVLAGDYEFRVGNATFSGGPGDMVVIPKGSQHTFTTATGGKLLFVCSPSGNEEMFLEMGELGPTATGDQLKAVSERFETVGLAGDDASWRQVQPGREGGS
ncbi:hypothetical protein GCM10022255_082250 [Dactylosporangium darangshiense]|uniref:Cupin type-2 domain-containing protein n=1 Tax=Dactylosporangium darangshiense TaxID=579108 RepID=A0ABP8DLL2_9ACTN